MTVVVREILIDWLKSHGYDGLYRDDDEDGCGCGVDDFIPCEEVCSDCKAGYMCGNNYGPKKVGEK